MSELGDQLREEVQRIIDEPMPEPSEPIRLETENIFDSAGYPLPPADDPFSDNPMKVFAGMMGDLKDMALHRGPFAMPAMPQLEHKVKIFWLSHQISRDELNDVAAEIEALLNDGYCCHIPTVCNDYVIMDFSRRKEGEEQ